MTNNPLALYGIPNCDQVKQARNWLAAHELPYQFHDFKKAGVSAELIAAWLGDVGLETLLNRKSSTWRGLPDERKAAVVDERSATALMIEYPSLIKRPLLNVDGRTVAGFSDTGYQQIFKN